MKVWLKERISTEAILRIKKTEIVIFPTDKSGKLAVSTPDIYKEAAKIHLDKDLEITWDKLKPTETLINRHVLQLAKAFRLGSTHNQEDRMKKALRAVDTPPPTTYLLWKDHEVYEVFPPVRPVCGAKVGPLVRASELASTILTKVADTQDRVSVFRGNQKELL